MENPWPDETRLACSISSQASKWSFLAFAGTLPRERDIIEPCRLRRRKKKSDPTKIEVNRPLVGVIAVACVVTSVVLEQLPDANEMWVAGFRRAGVMTGAVWLASAHEKASGRLGKRLTLDAAGSRRRHRRRRRSPASAAGICADARSTVGGRVLSQRSSRKTSWSRFVEVSWLAPACQLCCFQGSATLADSTFSSRSGSHLH